MDQLPLSFEDFIPGKHHVRVVNIVVDSLEQKPLYDRYKEGGCPAYHPRMMLKVMIYSFPQKTCSSRRIAKALRENINYMWIAGGNKPDFRTIDRFRLEKKDIIEDIFYEIIKLLIEKKYIALQTYLGTAQRLKPMPTSIFLYGINISKTIRSWTKR